MLEYHQVLEEKRKSRRTIADALEALGDRGNFYGRREIRVNPLPLPSGDTVGLVALFFEVPSRESCWVVSLPTSKRFRGSYPGSGQTVFDIFQLDRAFVDGKGN